MLLPFAICAMFYHVLSISPLPGAPCLDHEPAGSLSLLLLQQPWAIAQGRLRHRVEEVLVLGPQIYPVIQHGLPEYPIHFDDFSIVSGIFLLAMFDFRARSGLRNSNSRTEKEKSRKLGVDYRKRKDQRWWKMMERCKMVAVGGYKWLMRRMTMSCFEWFFWLSTGHPMAVKGPNCKPMD